MNFINLKNLLNIKMRTSFFDGVENETVVKLVLLFQCDSQKFLKNGFPRI
jgi:hypothetical protein